MKGHDAVKYGRQHPHVIFHFSIVALTRRVISFRASRFALFVIPSSASKSLGEFMSGSNSRTCPSVVAIVKTERVRVICGVAVGTVEGSSRVVVACEDALAFFPVGAVTSVCELEREWVGSARMRMLLLTRLRVRVPEGGGIASGAPERLVLPG